MKTRGEPRKSIFSIVDVRERGEKIYRQRERKSEGGGGAA